MDPDQLPNNDEPTKNDDKPSKKPGASASSKKSKKPLRKSGGSPSESKVTDSSPGKKKTALKKPGKVREEKAARKASSNEGRKDGTEKKAKKDGKPARKRKEVIYDDLDVIVYREGDENGVLTPDTMKRLLGWQEESENVKFGKNYLFTDRRGKKVRLSNNLTNRPFYNAVAEDWMKEILIGAWRLNGETMIFDRTGMAQDAQHRGVGLIWAAQEVEAHPSKYPYWEGNEPFIETIVVVGISDDDDTVNTIGTGKPRSLTDVIYRSELFASLPDKDRLKVARTASYAVKLLWVRTGADLVNVASRRSHSATLSFIYNHLRKDTSRYRR